MGVVIDKREATARILVRKARNNPDVWLEQVLGVKLTDFERVSVWGLRLSRHIVLSDDFSEEQRNRAAALMLIAHLHLWQDSLVITVAPNERRLDVGLWSWVESFYRGQKVPLGSEMRRWELRCSSTWYAKGFVADSPYTFMGLSPASDRVLVIVEGARDIQPGTLHSLRTLVDSWEHGCFVEFG